MSAYDSHNSQPNSSISNCINSLVLSSSKQAADAGEAMFRTACPEHPNKVYMMLIIAVCMGVLLHEDC